MKESICRLHIAQNTTSIYIILCSFGYVLGASDLPHYANCAKGVITKTGDPSGERGAGGLLATSIDAPGKLLFAKREMPGAVFAHGGGPAIMCAWQNPH